MNKNETFKWVVPSIFGVGARKEIIPELKARNCSKVLLFHGKSTERAGISNELMELLKNNDFDVLDCNESKPDPLESDVNRIGNLAREHGIDCIVAIGGGSAIDAAKAIKVLANNPGEINEYFLGTQKTIHTGIPLIAMPTTAGTGTEVDRAAMITADTDGGKKVLVGIGATPDLAIVDPELTVTCPPRITAGCGFDSLAHCIDAATGKVSNESIRLAAYTGIKLVKENLNVAVNDGSNIDARVGLHMASMLGGINIANANCSVAHSLAHGLGAAYHISHGECISIFTPPSLEFVAEESAAEIKEIGKLLGVNYSQNADKQTVAKKVSAFLYHWYRQLGLPDITELVPDKEDAITQITPYALADVNWRFCRKELTAESARTIIERAYKIVEEYN